MMVFLDSSGVSWTMCKQSAPRSGRITTPNQIKYDFNNG